jgi:hypothetical protein
MARDTTLCAAAAHGREEELTQAILALAAKYGCYGYLRWFTTILMVFSRITSLGLDACVPINSVRGSCPMPILADTILTISCPYCMEGTDLRPMIALRDGRFVCHDLCPHGASRRARVQVHLPPLLEAVAGKREDDLCRKVAGALLGNAACWNSEGETH